MDRYVTPNAENARAHMAALELAGFTLDPVQRAKWHAAPLRKWEYRVKEYWCAGKQFWCLSYRTNELSPPIPKQERKGTCGQWKCSNPHHAQGLCRSHYDKWRSTL